MKLHEVETESVYPLQDYKFLFDENDLPVGFGKAERPTSIMTIPEYENSISNLQDVLYDGYGKLYADEDGNLYGGETWYIGGKFELAVWQRVVKKELEE